MKRKTKIIFTLLFTLTLLASLTLFSFASEREVTNVDQTVFGGIYDVLSENADKIFSLLAFIGALILSFTYKKGLFPFIEKALSRLTGAVSTLREETEKSNAGANAVIAEITKKLAASESILNEFGSKIVSLEKKLKDAELLNNKTEEFRLVMLAEVEMIYDIFASSSLPEYQKEKVAEAYLKMKQALSEKEG